MELLYLLDTKRRSVGAKRNALLDIARGEYLSFIDDDDEVATDYVQKIYRTIVKTRKEEKPADVICFPQRATLMPSGTIHECTYSLENWEKRPPEERRRLEQTETHNTLKWSGPPAHTMCWRRDIAILGRFPEKNFQEDIDYIDKICAKAKTEIQITGEPLYFYNFSETGTATR
ncbi:MAG: glycosyltransferase [Planctomycetota bacterium]